MNDRKRMIAKARKSVLRSLTVLVISKAKSTDFANAIASLEKATKAFTALRYATQEFSLGWYDM